jgi:hypothetical protein
MGVGVMVNVPSVSVVMGVMVNVPSGSVVVGVSVIVEVILFGSNVQVGALVRLG